eukprot:SAG31_NODE_16037_length_726_cov_1.156300_1_plen_128_part_10
MIVCALFLRFFCGAAYHSLLCQLKASKQVVLLPPDVPPIVVNIVRRYEHLLWDNQNPWSSSLRRLIAASGASMAVLQPGDALHIPAFWYHSVESSHTESSMSFPCRFRLACAVDRENARVNDIMSAK